MTIVETIVKAVEDNPGKTASELASITGHKDKQVAAAIVQAYKRGYVTRKRRHGSERQPNIGLWVYFPY